MADDDKLARLHATLRAIERGERLESIDDILIRQVLQKQPRKPSGRPSPHSEKATSTSGTSWTSESRDVPDNVQGSDAYRVLLEFRREKKRQQQRQQQSTETRASSTPVKPPSPSKRTSPTKPLHGDATPSLAKRGFEPVQVNQLQEEDEKIARMARKEMNKALSDTESALTRSHQQVQVVTKDLHDLLAASQSILSSKFLFERNLTEFCQERSLQVIHRVLERFLHRFYRLYFERWVAVTIALREAEQRRAVAIIIRVFRGHQARRVCRLLRAEARKQREQKKQVVELRVSYRIHQARKIQLVWRRYLWRQCEKRRQRRREAASFLQKSWKTRKLRKNQLINALMQAKQIFAAIKIEKVARGHLTRQRLKKEARQKHHQKVAMEVFQRNTSRETQMQWRLERHGAAFVIRKAFYPVFMRQRFRRLIWLIKRQQAGKLIARYVCAWYGLNERRDRKRTAWLRALQKELARMNYAAIQIQKHAKRWSAQRQYKTDLIRKKKLARLERIRRKNDRKENQLASSSNPAFSHQATRAVNGLTSVLKQANRANKPPSIETERSQAATRIQRCFLRHRHHVKFRYHSWRKRAMQVEEYLHKRQLATIMIQKHHRGNKGRQLARVKRAEKLLVKHVRHWKWKRATRRSPAIQKITQWIKHKRSQHLAKLWRLEKERQRRMATKLQQWLRRRFFYRRRVNMILSLLRRREESVVFAQQSIQVCIQHYADSMILSSFFGDYDEQVKSRFGKGKKGERNQHQAAFPILPFIYLMVAGLKDSSKWQDTDVRDLLSAKMERSKMIALFKAVNQHVSNVSKSPPKSKSSSPSKKKKPTEMFSTTEVDLAMAKSAGSTKRPLIFDEFREALQSLADLKMNHVTIWWSRFEGPEARVLAMLWQYVFVVTDVKPLVALLTAHASSVVHERAKAIQRLMLKGRDKARGQLIRIQMLSEREMELKRNAITRVQCRIRVLLAKKQYKLKLQAQYEKYIDPDWMLPYWMNPRTGYSTWLKPRVLGDDDVSSEAIPFPTPALTLSMDCQGERECKICSDIYCYECDEAFCNKCVAQRFRKHDKADHKVEVILKCGLCKFQIASRKCIDCKAMKEARGGKRNGGKARQDKDTSDSDVVAAPEDDVLFCDVCFAFTHKRGALQVHKSLPLLEMCVDCLDDDEALDHEKAPPAKPFAKAVQWQCNTCFNRRVCSSCATTKHPVEACGALERVSLVTMTMKQRADRIARDIAEKERADVERMNRLILEAKRERCAKKIQKFWRNQAPLLRARRIARQLRGEKDAHWQQIQQDAKTQKEFKYRAKNLVGFAPPLPTDSPVQQKLREMNALQRRQLSIRARMFGLLISEYMVLGVPLPGIARVGRGQHFIECSEDLRGWLLNRQTIRLKKLPKVKRRRKELTDEPLPDFVWRHDLEKWMRDLSDTILVDIHSKAKLTERQVPLSIGFLVEPKKDGPQVAPKANEDENEELDIEEYALFLVEYSMDPKRVVWINHSFAEQFAAWRRHKFHAYRERQAQMKAEVLEKLQEAKKNEQKESTTQAPLVVDTAPVVAAATEDTTTSSTWPTATYPPETPATSSSAYYDYSGYYSQQTSWPTTSWASSPYGYDYSNAGYSGYDSTGATRVTDPSIPQLEASNEYFYADDGNAAAWEAYYQANPSATTDYSAGWNTGAEESYPYTGDYYNTGTETAYQQYDATYQQQSTYEVQPSSAAYATDAYPVSNYATAYDPYSETSAAYYTAGNYSTAGYEGYTTAASAATASWPWEEVFDPSTNQAYYYNHETQETSWQVPS